MSLGKLWAIQPCQDKSSLLVGKHCGALPWPANLRRCSHGKDRFLGQPLFDQPPPLRQAGLTALHSKNPWADGDALALEGLLTIGSLHLQDGKGRRFGTDLANGLAIDKGKDCQGASERVIAHGTIQQQRQGSVRQPVITPLGWS